MVDRQDVIVTLSTALRSRLEQFKALFSLGDHPGERTHGWAPTHRASPTSFQFCTGDSCRFLVVSVLANCILAGRAALASTK